MPQHGHKDNGTEVRIEQRRADMVRMLIRGHTQHEIAKALGISTAHVCREIKVVVNDWIEERRDNIDALREREYRRALHLWNQLLAAHDDSKVRPMYPKNKKGEVDYGKKPRMVPCQPDPVWLTQASEVLALICKIQGLFDGTSVTNNVNVFSMEKLVEAMQSRPRASGDDVPLVEVAPAHDGDGRPRATNGTGEVGK